MTEEPVKEMKGFRDTEQLLQLLQEKIEASINNRTAISISIEHPFMTLLEIKYIEFDEYKLDNQRLYFDKGNFEFTLFLKNITEIEFDDLECCLKFASNDTKINLYFYN